MVLAVLLAGCGKESKKEADKPVETQQDSAGEVSFPEQINEKISEQITVNADCVYPETCKTGTAKKAMLSGETLWDRRDALAKMFFVNGEYASELEDYDNVQVQRYYTQDESEYMSISTDGTLNYDTDLSSYVGNVLYYDDRFDDYNGDIYQAKSDHDFLSQQDAWTKVSELLSQVGIECDENYRCFVMDHETMSREEERIARELAQDEYGKQLTKKEQWTAEDDCYYFQTKILWQDYPVLPVYSGEGIDEENITVIYGRNGLVSLSVNGFFPLAEADEITIQSPEKVVDAVNVVLGNLISQETYEIQRISLCQKPMGTDTEKNGLDIELVWECSVDVQYDENDHYTSNFYFLADTLKAV